MITFGIITYDGHDIYMNKIIDSIRKECYDGHYEILIVGADHLNGIDDLIANNVLHFIPYDRVLKDNNKAWLSRQKNLITQNAKYDIIVYMHDYIALHHEWMDGIIAYNSINPDWDVMMTRINNTDLTRYRDWVIWDDPQYKGFPQTALPPYSYNKTQFMYVSGAYWVAKKYVMIDLPLNEELFQCEGEDVEWSKRMRQKYKYVFNPYSQVDLLQYKHVVSRRCY